MTKRTREHKVKYLYDLIFLLFSIIYLPYLFIKGKAHKDFKERFGFLPHKLKGFRKDAIWVHAVSVGEVLAVKSLINRLKEAFPEQRIILSTTTKTGNEMARKTFGETVLRFYFPIDFHNVVERIIDFINPLCFILVETEIWPNLILALSYRKVPVFIVNGRISDKSFRGYRLIKRVFSLTLKRIKVFLMQTDQDAERIIALGAPGERVKVTGNVKYDIEKKRDDKSQMPEVNKKDLGINESEHLLICGSTHKGEEEILLGAYKKLLEVFPSLRLLIAPRHVDRAGDIEKVCSDFGFTSCRISNPKVQPSNAVLILDTMGELSRLYSIASVVFMGGSLIKRGGHNIVEPAAHSKPILFGPFMHNFRDMAGQFLTEGAALKVCDQLQLVSAITALIMDNAHALEMGTKACRLVTKNKGAVERIVKEIQTQMTDQS